MKLCTLASHFDRIQPLSFILTLFPCSLLPNAPTDLLLSRWARLPKIVVHPADDMSIIPFSLLPLLSSTRTSRFGVIGFTTGPSTTSGAVPALLAISVQLETDTRLGGIGADFSPSGDSSTGDGGFAGSSGAQGGTEEFLACRLRMGDSSEISENLVVLTAFRWVPAASPLAFIRNHSSE